MEEFYYREITGASYQELRNFAAWMNKFFGHHPTIAGGWAVWCYTRGLGSRDIDVVFMNRDTLERALNHYFYHNGYEEVGLLEKSYVKKIATPKREEEIIVDACTAADTRILRDLGVELPWRWALEDSRQHALETGENIYIPNPELLLTYKMGAALGRLQVLKRLPEKAYAESKIWKDLYDAGSLIGKGLINPEKLHPYLETSGIIGHKQRFIQELNERKEILSTLALRETDIETALCARPS